MKRFICIALCALAFFSCGPSSQNGSPEPTRPKSTRTENTDTWVVELTHDDETHEYIMHKRAGGKYSWGGMAHWESCKFCKGRKVERTDIELENGEVHEAFIIQNDTATITDHCDDCRYCRTQNPEGNPD